MTLYNIDFDIASIIISVLTFVNYLRKRHVNTAQHNLFLLLFLSSSLLPVFDIASVYAIENHFSRDFAEAALDGYYICIGLTSFFFLSYTVSLMEIRRSVAQWKKGVFLVPISIILILVLSNPVLSCVFYYSDGNFEPRSMRTIVYLMSYLYYGWLFVYANRHKQIVSSTYRGLVGIIGLVNVLVETVQLFFPTVLLVCFSLSLCILIMVLNIERYAMVVNPLNRMATKEHFDSICTKMIFNDNPFHVVLIRINDYELVSSNFGIQTTESVIREIERFLLTFVNTGRVFQISNNSFVLLLHEDANVTAIMDEIYDGLKLPIFKNNVEIAFEYYITFVSFPSDFRDMEGLLAYINYFQTMQGIALGIVDKDDLKISDTLRIQQVIRAIDEGLKDGNLEVYYQPIYDVKEKKFVSAEALIRLKDSVLGFISPDEFIRIAEVNGSILQIGEYVIEEVCKFIQNHDMEELGLHYIELNLSMVQCLQNNLISTIRKITKKYGVSSKYLCFEVTETAANNAPVVFSRNLTLLTDYGFKLALDDFGTGYGNLERMITSHFSFIKFDKTMTQKLSGSLRLQGVYRTIAAMVTTMNSEIVSEGVETKEQFDFVCSAGSRYIQGYYFSKPLQASEFEEFLLEKN